MARIVKQEPSAIQTRRSVFLDKDLAECEDGHVRVISRKEIRGAIVKHSEWEASLSACRKVAKNTQWKHFGEIRQTWRSVDRIGTCVVFDIANNRCRLIAWISYEREKLFIRHILDQAEYGREKWKMIAALDKKYATKDLRFFGDRAPKKWPCGQLIHQTEHV